MFRWFILPQSDDGHPFNAELTQDEAIHFKDLEFIAEHSNDQCLSLEGNDLGAVFVGTAHSGSLSLHAILEELPSEDDSVSSNGWSSGYPMPQKCNMVTSAIPVTTTPPSDKTLALQTILAVPRQADAPQPVTRLFPERWLADQEERQRAP
jgi:hypothetical protein